MVDCAITRAPGNQRFELRDQRGKVVPHGLPDPIKPDGKIAVNEMVSHTDDLCPRNVRMPGFRLLTDS